MPDAAARLAANDGGGIVSGDEYDGGSAYYGSYDSDGALQDDSYMAVLSSKATWNLPEVEGVSDHDLELVPDTLHPSRLLSAAHCLRLPVES